MGQGPAIVLKTIQNREYILPVLLNGLGHFRVFLLKYGPEELDRTIFLEYMEVSGQQVPLIPDIDTKNWY
ncbi:MAG: hypothetical protein ABEJ65_01870 [bacterium]